MIRRALARFLMWWRRDRGQPMRRRIRDSRPEHDGAEAHTAYHAEIDRRDIETQRRLQALEESTVRYIAEARAWERILADEARTP